MKLTKKLFTMLTALCLLASILMTGCAAAPAVEGEPLKETGILTLSVNPEIQIEYNKEGKVVALTGKNEDGKGIVAAYQDYIGKDCQQVLKDLIVEINKAGYFVEDIDGHNKNIVLQLEPGSVLPDDDFLANLSVSTKDAVKGLHLNSGIVTIGDQDYDPAYAKNGSNSPYITLEKAQEIALTQANVKAKDAVFDDRDFDFENGVAVFELEFVANGVEYEYDIDAVTGKVVKAEHHQINAASSSGSYNATDYGKTDYGRTDYNDTTDYGKTDCTDYNDTTDYGKTDYTDYNDTTDYGKTDYTDYNDTTDYGKTDYTDYNDTTDYGKSDYTDYNDTTDYGKTDYDSSDYRKG